MANKVFRISTFVIQVATSFKELEEQEEVEEKGKVEEFLPELLSQRETFLS